MRVRVRAAEDRRLAAFTLIELVVSVAIILLLVGILAPVVTAARRQGYAANSTANLRQIATALALYQEHVGAQPPTYHALILAQPSIQPLLSHAGDPEPDGVGNAYGGCLWPESLLPFRSSYISLLDGQLLVPDLERTGEPYAWFVDLSLAKRVRAPAAGELHCGSPHWAGKAIRAFADTSVVVGRYGPVVIDGREGWSMKRWFQERYPVEKERRP